MERAPYVPESREGRARPYLLGRLPGSSGSTTELRRADEIKGDGGLEITPAEMQFPTVVVTGTATDGGLTVRSPGGKAQGTIGFNNESIVQTFSK